MFHKWLTHVTLEALEVSTGTARAKGMGSEEYQSKT